MVELINMCETKISGFFPDDFNEYNDIILYMKLIHSFVFHKWCVLHVHVTFMKMPSMYISCFTLFVCSTKTVHVLIYSMYLYTLNQMMKNDNRR